MPSVSSKAALLAVATLLEPGSSTSSRRLSGISDLPSFINHVRKMKEVDSSAYELESTTAINCAFDPAFVGAVISNDCLEIAWCDMGHAFVHHSCGEGLIFEETNLTCVPKNDSICHSKYPEAQQAEILQIKPSLPAKVPTTNPITRGLTPPPTAILTITPTSSPSKMKSSSISNIPEILHYLRRPTPSQSPMPSRGATRRTRTPPPRPSRRPTQTSAPTRRRSKRPSLKPLFSSEPTDIPRVKPSLPAKAPTRKPISRGLTPPPTATLTMKPTSRPSKMASSSISNIPEILHYLRRPTPPSPRPSQRPTRRPLFSSECPSTDAFNSSELVGFVDANVIPEASGLVNGIRNPRVLYTHNDRSGMPQIFAIDALTGDILAAIPIMNAMHTDYEDITVGPGPNGAGFIYVGDIGDNYRYRSHTVVYRILEPDVLIGSIPVIADSLTLTYSDLQKGINAECMMYDPFDGRLYFITKESRRIYKTERTWGEGDDRMNLEFLGLMRTDIGSITGCDIDKSGLEILVKSYTSVSYYCRGPGESLANVLIERIGTRLPYDEEPQGEAIAFGEGSPPGHYFTLSESIKGENVPLYRHGRL